MTLTIRKVRNPESLFVVVLCVDGQSVLLCTKMGCGDIYYRDISIHGVGFLHMVRQYCKSLPGGPSIDTIVNKLVKDWLNERK